MEPLVRAWIEHSLLVPQGNVMDGDTSECRAGRLRLFLLCSAHCGLSRKVVKQGKSEDFFLNLASVFFWGTIALFVATLTDVSFVLTFGASVSWHASFQPSFFLTFASITTDALLSRGLLCAEREDKQQGWV
jgi:hypothetical protein